jgi:hypothetical protein
MHLVKNVSEPWFTQIAARKKIVEGRLYKPDSWIWSRVTQWRQWMRTLASNDRSRPKWWEPVADIPSILDRKNCQYATESRSDDRGQGSQDLQTFLWREGRNKNGVLAIKIKEGYTSSVGVATKSTRSIKRLRYSRTHCQHGFRLATAITFDP